MRNKARFAICAVATAAFLSGCSTEASLDQEKTNRVEFDSPLQLNAAYSRLVEMAQVCWTVEFAIGRYAEIEPSIDASNQTARIDDVWPLLFNRHYEASINLTGTSTGTHAVVTYFGAKVFKGDFKKTAEGVGKWLEGDRSCYGGF